MTMMKRCLINVKLTFKFVSFCYTRLVTKKAIDIERERMFLSAYLVPFMKFCVEVFFPRENETLSDMVKRLLRGIVFACVLVVLSQQLMLFWDLYKQKEQERLSAWSFHVEESCADYRGPSQLRRDECARNNIILNTWPLTRAVTHLVRSWNSCLYMPCGDLVRQIATHLEYKIAFILFSLGVASYVANFFACFKRKSIEYSDKLRYKKTQQEQLRFIEQQLATLHKPNTTTTATTSDCRIPI